MNHTSKVKRALQAVALGMVALLLPLTSCKKESVNASDLLSSVPSSSSVVVGINLESLLKKSGCKIEGSQIAPGAEIQAWLGKSSMQASKEGRIAQILLNGESGIDPTGAIYFKDSYNDYVTVALADTDKFKGFIEKETGAEFVDAEGDVEVCGNVAIKGAQAWIAGGTTIDPKGVANFSTLGEGQSFMTKDFSDKFANMTSDIVGWGEINKIIGRKLGISERSTMRMVLGMLFDDAQSVCFTVDMLKGEAKSTISVLNKEDKPAKYLLPTDKLDLETVKKVAYKANAIVAVSITKDLIKKIDNILTSFGGSQMEKVSKALKSVDGTMAVAFGNLDNAEESMRGIVTTDGKAGLDLMQVISSIAPINKDGNLVRFSKGEVDGALTVKEDAEFLKNSTMGVVLNVQSLSGEGGTDNAFKTLVVAFEPKGGNVECSVMLKATNDSRNVMLPIIETFAK